MPFISFPAFRFQENLKEALFTKSFWDDIYTRIHKIEMENLKKEEMEKIKE